MANQDTKCKDHPDAPHSFNRNASLTEDRYVCDCEYWEPPVDAVNMSQERVDETAKGKHEPVAWMSIDCIGERYLCFSKPTDNDKILPLYTAPPKREWVGLTAHDKAVLIDQMWNQSESFEQFMDSIDKFLKEKNA